jgi:hypothetical protein
VISFETAKALKDAGLVWEPKLGDQILNPHYGKPEITMCQNLPKIMPSYIIWLPRLDQLLAEIVKNNWGYRLSVLWIEDFPAGYECLLSRREETEEGEWEEFEHCFDSPESPEEAAAQALLWILRKEATK